MRRPDCTVRKVVFKSSAALLRLRAGRPGVLHRGDAPPAPAAHADSRGTSSRPSARSRTSPTATRRRRVTVLRFANGARAAACARRTCACSSLPAVPTILGFDPRCQFIHEDDIAGALEHAVAQRPRRRLQLRRRRRARAIGGHRAARQADRPRSCRRGGPAWPRRSLRRAGVPFPPEMLQQLRFGRGLDNRRLKATGFRYRYTTREAVLKLREHQRLAPLTRSSGEGYRYEREVEEFLRCSPSVRRPTRRPSCRATWPRAGRRAPTRPTRGRRPRGRAVHRRRARPPHRHLRRPITRTSRPRRSSPARRALGGRPRAAARPRDGSCRPPVGARSDRQPAGPSAHARLEQTLATLV